MNPHYLPDLKHIRTFLAVIRCGSFSMAAKELNMTQPGVSIHLRKLEALLGQQLLERSQSGILTTSAGKRFLPIARELIDKANVLTQTFADHNAELDGWLKLGASGPFREPVLSSIAFFRRQHPNLKISVKFQSDENSLTGLKCGDLDIALCTHVPDDKSLSTTEIYQEEMHLVGHADYAVSDVCKFEDFTQLEFIDHPSRSEISEHWVAHHFHGVKLANSELKYSLFIDDLGSLISLMKYGSDFGYGILPQSAINANKLTNSVRVVKGPKPNPVMQSIYQTLRKNQYYSRSMKLFTRQLKIEADSLLNADLTR